MSDSDLSPFSSGPVDDLPGDASDVASPPDTRRNLGILAVLAVGLLAFGGLYVGYARTRVADDLVDRQARALEAVRAFEEENGRIDADPTEVPEVEVELAESVAPKPGEVMFVNRVPGDDYGRLGIRHSDGSRTLLAQDCLRVHIAADHGVCLSETDPVLGTFETTFFEASNPAETIKSYASASPSRARISPDGTFSTVTAFISGGSYADIGIGETTTVVTIDEVDSNVLLRGAGQFEVNAEQSRYQTFDANYWGLTFVDQENFYITGFYDTLPEIMQGTLSTMTIEPTGWIGSCPSISPDGKTLVFKEQRPDGHYDLVAVDVETQEKRLLGETRSVDDQVEWLDNDTILYALHPEDGDLGLQPQFDIWELDLAEGSEPKMFLPSADSPAVAR